MLQFITHRNSVYDEVSGAEAVLEGGCRWVQLRMKDSSGEEIIRAGRKIRELCTKYGAVFIVDDHVELVNALGADGVHLGKNDMPVAEARKILGPDKTIGATANTFADIEKAVTAGADYIGLGPFRFTVTKRNLSPVLGLEGYSSIMKKCAEAGISVPVVAIGGITAEDIGGIMETGVAGIAVSGALLNAADVSEETGKMLEKIRLSDGKGE